MNMEYSPVPYSGQGGKILFLDLGGTGSCRTGPSGALEPIATTEEVLDVIWKMDAPLKERYRARVVPESMYNLDSTEMIGRHREFLTGRIVRAEKEGYEGILIKGGTDKMGNNVTYPALHAPFKKIKVVHTGAETPLFCDDRSINPASDLPANIRGGLMTLDSDIEGDHVYLQDNLYMAVRMMKFGRDKRIPAAYMESPHYPPTALMKKRQLVWDKDAVEFQKWYKERAEKWRALGLPEFIEYPRHEVAAWIGRIKLHDYTNPIKMDRDVMEHFAIIIEGYGDGGVEGTMEIPSGDSVEIEPIVKRWCDMGKIVIFCSRTPRSRADLTTYGPGVRLLKNGALMTYDALADVFELKLGLGFGMTRRKGLLGYEPDIGLTKRFMMTNFMGEIDPDVIGIIKRFSDEHNYGIDASSLIMDEAGIFEIARNYKNRDVSFYTEDEIKMIYRTLTAQAVATNDAVSARIEDGRLPVHELRSLIARNESILEGSSDKTSLGRLLHSGPKIFTTETAEKK